MMKQSEAEEEICFPSVDYEAVLGISSGFSFLLFLLICRVSLLSFHVESPRPIQDLDLNML